MRVQWKTVIEALNFNIFLKRIHNLGKTRQSLVIINYEPQKGYSDDKTICHR